MIYKKDLQAYEFSSIEEYFEYIVTSYINGVFSQVNNLINQLSKDQKKDFIDWCNIQTNENIFEGSHYDRCAKIALELI